MCLKTLLDLFRPKVITPQLPHPEEPVNPSQTVANTSVDGVITEWLISYRVPTEYHSFWRTQVEVFLYDEWPPELLSQFGFSNPCGWATVVDGKRQIYSLARWFNPGVVAHEIGHQAFFTLPEDTQKAFRCDYNKSLTTNKSLQLFATQRFPPNDTELHAEVYRFLGETIPMELREYYPRLF